MADLRSGLGEGVGGPGAVRQGGPVAVPAGAGRGAGAVGRADEPARRRPAARAVRADRSSSAASCCSSSSRWSRARRCRCSAARRTCGTARWWCSRRCCSGGYAYAHAMSRLPLRRAGARSISRSLAVAGLTLPIALPRPAARRARLGGPVGAGAVRARGGPGVRARLGAGLANAALVRRARPAPAIPIRFTPRRTSAASPGCSTYPLWLEPTTSLSDQSRVWTLGYLALIALVALVALVRWNARPRARRGGPRRIAADTAAREPLARSRVLPVAGARRGAFGAGAIDHHAADHRYRWPMPLLWVIPARRSTC